MTDGLKKILRGWLDWAENGAGEHRFFRRYVGLCDVTACYSGSFYCEIVRLLKDDFPNISIYPFGGVRGYHSDRHNQTMHLNPERLAWVRKQLEEVES